MYALCVCVCVGLFGQRENVKCFVIMHRQMGLGSSRVERVHKSALSPSNFREEINESDAGLSRGDKIGRRTEATNCSVCGKKRAGGGMWPENASNNRFLAQLFKWALSAGSQRGSGAAEVPNK